MSPEDYQRIKAIFNSALELPPEDREAFVVSELESGSELHKAVTGLLAAHDRTDEFIESPAVAYAPDILEEGRNNRKIGNYRILRELGRGGMGTVYLAERADAEFEQKVAIKLIKRGMDTDEILRRFRQERQILAELNHPNIARLLDGGTTEDGLPYFVMEYVEGLPIGRFCSEERLGLEQRLEVFRHVCSAVAYAHQHLVVHRDIKPSNILVTSEGVPKLLDFGIAKLISSDDGLTQTITKLGAMTPDYASPEQLTGAKITTATDVYSLGKVLFELVGMDANHYRAQGDLKAILQTALREEPLRRYRSVEQFAHDIDRYLSQRPVSARADNIAYRASKFVKRNRLAVGAAALIFGLLVVGVISVVYQGQVAAAERDRAQAALAKAERIDSFLQQALGSANPLQDGREVKVVDVLDKAAKRAESELAADPEVLAQVQRTIGVTYYNLEIYDKAEPLLRSAVDIFESVYGKDDARTALVQKELGDLLSFADQVEEAIRLLARAVSTLETAPSKLRESLDARYSLSQAHYFKGDNAAAEAGYRQIMEIANLNSMQNEMIMADVSHELANLIRDTDDSAALELYERSAAIVRPLPEKRMNLGTCLSNIGLVLIELGRYDEAERSLSESLQIRREIFGDESPVVAVVLTNLSRVHLHRGEVERAEQTANQAVTMLGKKLPPNHRNFGPAYLTLGHISLVNGHLSSAEDYLNRGLSIFKAKHDSRSVGVAESLLGECISKQKRHEEAELLLKNGLDKLKSKLGENHPRTLEASKRLNDFYSIRK